MILTALICILPYLANGVIDTTDIASLGLTMTEDTQTVTIFSPSRVKQSAGNMPDGTAYLAGSPTGTKRRYPLAVLFSEDGVCFDKAILLRSGGTDLQPQRYPGKAKTLGYNYPKSMVYNGKLYVAYATNKEDVECTIINIKTKQR